MMQTGIIFDIKKFALHDGPGIRTTVFFKGCPLRCLWCHNPEGMFAEPEILFNRDRCIDCGHCIEACPQKAVARTASGLSRDGEKCRACGTCIRTCPSEAWEQAGREMTAEAVMTVIEKDIPFYRQSGGGVTFSGGEPLMQPDFLLELLDRCGRLELHRALDTCGHADPGLLVKAAERAELILYDIKHTDPAKHLEQTGVSNDLILDNLRLLSGLKIDIMIRVPVIPGFNDDIRDMERLAGLIRSLPRNHMISLLPYHSTAGSKYGRMGKKYGLEDVLPPNRQRMEQLSRVLEDRHLKVNIGG